MKRTVALLALVLLLFAPMNAFGHAVVYPATSRPGAYERYVLRVPNESDNPTVRVEMTFPDEMRVISFSDVPGWKLETKIDNSGRALSAVWTGSLPPERFVELPFIAVNPKSSARVVWPVTQIYANGDTVVWAGPSDSDKPASVTVIGVSEGEAPSRLPLLLSGAAAVLALIAVVVAARRGGSPTT